MSRIVVLAAMTSALVLVSGRSPHARQQSDFLSLARCAIADPQTLADVHALHITLISATTGDVEPQGRARYCGRHERTGIQRE
jgi:hypothetical protein